MDIKDKVIVITGAARGLGAAMARALAPRGAKLALVDVDAAALEGIVGECREAGVEARGYSANVAKEDDVVKLFDDVAGDFGALDAVVNNAGILRDGLLIKARDGEITGKMSLAQWQSVIDVNLTGVFLCGREAAERMIKLGSKGVIINISSISRAGNMGQTNYSAAKAGVAAMAVVWAKELARYGIRANAIAPGFVNTEMVASMKPEALDKMKAMIPLRRMAEPEEIAHTVVYLIENDYVSGRVVEVDGALRL
ncbi:MAG: SDR family oxidoreductase [Gammaproteobacteria bacterium]|nr:SDR family oxidoreductase [Gammaproteobacteria bacterium]TVQ44625.1 MAG: SDR family oxidoreductase [Gammaproteobacteria bacterium]